AWLRTIRALPQGIPAHDTVHRVVAARKAQPVQACFGRGRAAGATGLPPPVRARDGKTGRGAHDRATATAALPRVRVGARANRLRLAPVTVDAQSHAITALPELLWALARAGGRVTGDALGGQRAIAPQRIEAGGAAVLALTQNQATRDTAVVALVAPAQAGPTH